MRVLGLFRAGVRSALPLLMLAACFAAGCGDEKCEYRGDTYEEGDSWSAGDGCNTCWCGTWGVWCSRDSCGRDAGLDARFAFDAGPDARPLDGGTGDAGPDARTDAGCDAGVRAPDGGFCVPEGDAGYCDHPGLPGGEAGDLCADETQCEPDGRCFTDGEGWPGGYCTKLGCDIEGRECSGEGACVEGHLEVAFCAETCLVAAEDEEDRLGPGGHGQGCDTGYACIPQQPTVTSLGGCIPGNYNDVTEPNVGAPCSDDSECYSPYGLGRCMARDPSCPVPGIDGGVPDGGAADGGAADAGPGERRCTIIYCALLPDGTCGDHACGGDRCEVW